MPRVRPTYAKRWCFTLNNPTDGEKEHIVKQVQAADCQYCIIGMEVGASKTPHLQGYYHGRSRLRLTQLKTLLGIRIHAEMARGTDTQNKAYCSKDGSILVELGTPSDTGKENGGGFTLAKAARSATESLSRGEGPELLMADDHQWTAYLRHQKTIEGTAQVLKQSKIMQGHASAFKDTLFRDWQCDLIKYVQDVPSPREIRWYVDYDGNTGKTFMSKYLCAVFGAIRFENGKSSDIKHAYQGERVALFDLSRSQEEHFNYEVLESIKNGIMFSPKYDSKQKVFDVPHVIVFANWDPDLSKLSKDRWSIMRMSELSQKNTKMGSELVSGVSLAKGSEVKVEPSPIELDDYEESGVSDVSAIVISDSDTDDELPDLLTQADWRPVSASQAERDRQYHDRHCPTPILTESQLSELFGMFNDDKNMHIVENNSQ